MPTSNDLMNKHFEKASFGGYKAADVDEFMEDLRIYISEKTRDMADLKKRLDKAEKKAELYANGEESIKDTLINAQVLANKITKEANEKAEQLLNDANAKAESTLRSAKIKAENLVDCAESEVEMRKNEAETIKTEVYNFKMKLMKLYRAQLELIHDIPAETPQAPAFEEPTEENAETAVAPSTEEASETAQPLKEEADVEEPIETSETPAATVPVTAPTTAPAQEPKNAPRTAVPMSANVSSNTNVEEAKPEEKDTDDKTFASEAVNAALDEAAAQSAPTEVKTEEEPEVPSMRTVKLNLRYNEKTGEYEPLGATHEAGAVPTAKGKNGDGLKFGADYNIRTDSFDRK